MGLVASELTAAIEKAFADEWQRTKSISLPAAGSEDRRLLMTAIAVGLLRYLATHEGDFLTELTMHSPAIGTATYSVSNAQLEISY